jgi:hypothetical protein
MRAAERSAKVARLRLWHDYRPAEVRGDRLFEGEARSTRRGGGAMRMRSQARLMNHTWRCAFQAALAGCPCGLHPPARCACGLHPLARCARRRTAARCGCHICVAARCARRRSVAPCTGHTYAAALSTARNHTPARCGHAARCARCHTPARCTRPTLSPAELLYPCYRLLHSPQLLPLTARRQLPHSILCPRPHCRSLRSRCRSLRSLLKVPHCRTFRWRRSNCRLLREAP